MAVPPIDVVLPARSRLGECPLWDAEQRVLWWIDIDSRRIHRTDPSTGGDEVREIDGRPGSIVLTSDPNRLVAGVEHAIADVDWPTGELTERVVVEDDPARPTRLNDGRCDPRGRYWLGSMHDPDTSGIFAGGFYRVDAVPDAPDRVHVLVRGGVGITNGLAFSPDGATMYWADSPRRTVWAYDFDVDSGERRNQRVFTRFGGSGAPGYPDGACVDADGCYWSACVTAGHMARFTPAGELDRLIETPMAWPTMPAFGGDDLSTMFVTSIGGDGDGGPVDPDDPMAGALIAIDLSRDGITGVVEPRYAG